jgi:uncharacterized membrane protein
MKQLSKPRTLYGIITIAAAVGFLASFLQMLEKITLLAHPHAALTCNINAIFSCTNILNAWQSSVFGFPNALMCLIFFTTTMAIGLVGWTGGTITRKLRLVFMGLALFFICFGFWYLWQSIFIVGAMCIFCVFCYGGVLVASGAWLRINQKELPVSKRIQRIIDRLIASNNDIYIWLFIALAIVLEIVIKFA